MNDEERKEFERRMYKIFNKRVIEVVKNMRMDYNVRILYDLECAIIPQGEEYDK